MKINQLKIHNFRNFKDFEINFNSNYNIDIILGLNGVGKTSLLDFIDRIFTFCFSGYEVEYTSRGSVVNLIAKDECSFYDMIADGVKISRRELLKKQLLPLVGNYTNSDYCSDCDCQDLSDGERQFKEVSQLLSKSSEESLLLLDNPTNYSSPLRSQQFFQNVDIDESSHIIIATQDPLLILGLDKEQIHILEHDELGNVTVRNPDRSPRGVGVAGVLTSDMFGLHSTLDQGTLNLLDKKRKLSATSKAFGKDQMQELTELNDKLKDVGFSQSFRDPLFEEYTKAMARKPELRELKHKFNIKKEIEQRQVVIDDTLTKILKD